MVCYIRKQTNLMPHLWDCGQFHTSTHVNRISTIHPECILVWSGLLQLGCNRSCNTALGSPMFRYDTTTAPQDLHEHWSQPAPQCGQLLHLGLLHDWGQAVRSFVRSLEQRTDDADEGLVHFAHQHTDPPGKSALLRHLWCCGADDHGWDVEPLRYVWSSTGL